MGHMCTPNYCTDAKNDRRPVTPKYLSGQLRSGVPELQDRRHDGKESAPEKILMGSDWPGSHFSLSIQKTKLSANYAKDPEKAFEMMAGGNIAKILNLKV